MANEYGYGPLVGEINAAGLFFAGAAHGWLPREEYIRLKDRWEAAAVQYKPRATGDARYAGLDEGFADFSECAPPRFNIKARAGQSFTVTADDGITRALAVVGGDHGATPAGSLTLTMEQHYTCTRVDREFGAVAEHARILAEVEKLKPRIRPSHGDWARAWRDEGALAMYEKIIAAINKPAKAEGE